jgi:cytochrome c5
MSKKTHDKDFTNLFSVVIGGLVGIAIAIFAFARLVGANAEVRSETDPSYRAEVQERIAPIGKVAIGGHDNAALAIPDTAPKPAAAAGPAPVLAGDAAYQQVCATCHGAGIAGAPKFGDKQAWGPRIAQGIAMLHQHALKGVTGEAGVMPAKGGRMDLNDQSVLNAVDYMVKAGK